MRSPRATGIGRLTMTRTTAELRHEVMRILEASGGPSPAAETTWLLRHVVGSTPRKTPTRDQSAEVLGLAVRRATGEPLQYVLGVAGFRRIDLLVGPGVFIPRPETEILVEHVLRLVEAGATVVDVGTGSGAIALSIADESPGVRVLATESSPDALAWAVGNRDRLGLDVDLIRGDLLDPIGPGIDVVVANPPYVAESERDLLPRDVLDHEPYAALFAGDDGLAVIRRLVQDAPRVLRAGGWLVFEIGERQGNDVSAIMRESGFTDVSIEADLAGRDRICVGRRERR